MINQVLFLFGLYVLGVYFGLLFKRDLPVTVIAVTGFLWGALFWVLGGMCLLVAAIAYTPASMIIYLGILVSVFSIIHARRKTWRLSRREIFWLLAIATFFLLVLITASYFNLSTTSPDSIVLISTGRRMAYEGLSDTVMKELSLRGVYMPVLQSASSFLGDGYLYAAQPGIGVTFTLVFFFLSHWIIGQLGSKKRLNLMSSILTSLALFSTYFIVFQFFYINTNTISALYLFVAVSAFWLGLIEDKRSWLVFGMLALLGFSLARTEAPLFALVFLLLVVGVDRIPYRVRLRATLPYAILLILWYLYLLWRMGDGTQILNPERTLVILVALVGFGFFILISEGRWIKGKILPYLPWIMIGALLLILLSMVLLKPGHMKDSVYYIFMNMLGFGWWGITWLVISILYMISLKGPSLPYEGIFSYGIPSFFSLVVALSFFRVPYRLGWGDSANRMMVHILPIIALYLMMKAVKASSGRDILKNRPSIDS